MWCQWGWLALHLVPLSWVKSSLSEAPKKLFPHVCVCPWFGLMMKKGVFGRYGCASLCTQRGLEQVEKGGRQTTTL